MKTKKYLYKEKGTTELKTEKERSNENATEKLISVSRKPFFFLFANLSDFHVIIILKVSTVIKIN